MKTHIEVSGARKHGDAAIKERIQDRPKPVRPQTFPLIDGADFFIDIVSVVVEAEVGLPSAFGMVRSRVTLFCCCGVCKRTFNGWAYMRCVIG